MSSYYTEWYCIVLYRHAGAAFSRRDLSSQPSLLLLLPKILVPTITRLIFLVYAGSFCVSVIHRTRRIFNVRTWSFFCVRIHTGVGHTTPTTNQRNIFDLKKPAQICLMLLTGFEPRVDLWISSTTLYALSHTVAPFRGLKTYSVLLFVFCHGRYHFGEPDVKLDQQQQFVFCP